MLGLAMVPGRHVVSLSVDDRTINQRQQHLQQQQLQQQMKLDDPSLSLSSYKPPLADQSTATGSSGSTQAQALDPPSGYT